jgi:hypothetical protein
LAIALPVAEAPLHAAPDSIHDLHAYETRRSFLRAPISLS